MKTKSGTNLVENFRRQAPKQGQNLFIGSSELPGTPWPPHLSTGIWIYKPGTPTKANPPVATAESLDELYGRT